MPKPKPSTITRDPYAQDPYAFIGTPVGKETAKPPTEPVKTEKISTEKITIPFPANVIERARNAAYWERKTLSGIVVQALAEMLDRMELDRGEPYAERESQLRGGRPVGTPRK